MLDKLRLLSRLVRSLTRPGRSTRHSHPSAIAEPIEPRLLLTTFIRYVDANAPAGGTQNGLSWSTAYRDLQSALSAANPSTNDTYEVRVADGAYLPTARTTSSDPRSATFSLKKRIHLYGSYGGYGAVDPDARDITAHSTILSGDLGVSGNNSDNSYHVLLGSGTDNTAVLDGFAIIAGNAGADAPQDGGGGMYTVSGSPVLRNCLFAGNTAAGQNWGGGGMCNVDSAPVLINCVFRGNATDGAGGAMYNMRSSPDLTNCVFIGNTANNGGGLYNQGSSSHVPRLRNCTFSVNRAAYFGGGISSSGCSPIITNCILWGQSSALASTIYGNAIVTYSNIEGGYAGTGNIAADPQFVRTPSPGPDGAWGTADDWGDLRLRFTSPCIDAGNNSAVPVGVVSDSMGNPRFQDIPATSNTGGGAAPVVDIGACEAQAAVQAYARGPYGVIEGGSVVLSGAGDSPSNLGLVCEWDFDGDGDFDDAVGASPAFSAATMSAPLTLSIALRVTDTSGAATTSVALLRVLTLVYVDDITTGLNNGTSWENAYRSPNAALATAVEGQVILVAQGTYKPTADTDRARSFCMGDAVSLIGGYAGYGAADPDAWGVEQYPSILSGDIGTAGDNADNAYHVVTGSYVSRAALLDGFTITGGNANGYNPHSRGGGLHNYRGSPTIQNCTFVGHSASSQGGGAYNDSAFPALIDCTWSGSSSYYGGGMYNFASAPMLVRCAFSANSADGDGGGMYNKLSSPTLADCSFSGNSTVYAGAGMCNNASSPALTGCTFSGNVSNSNGGGMRNEASSSPIVMGCTFSENLARQGGGMSNASSSPTVTDCTFVRNQTMNAYGSGAGMSNSSSSPTVTNCVFSGNMARDSGGGVFNGSSSSPILANCTFAGNTASSGGGLSIESSSPTLANCAFVGNIATSGGGLRIESASPTLANCTFVGNISNIGGGLYLWSASPRLVNCTFSGNLARSQGGGFYANSALPTLTNSIVFGNSAPFDSQFYSGSSTLAVAYSNVQGGYAGTGNINANPLFIRDPSPGLDGAWGTGDDDYGDLRLQPNSPCIDAGRNDAVPVGISTDLAGNPRFADISDIADTGLGTAPIVDMGAYEAFLPVPLLLPSTDASDAFTLRLSPDGLSLQYWPTSSADGQPAAVYPLSGLTTCSFAPSAGLDTLRLDFSNGVPIPAAGLILPADDQIIVTADDTTRPELLYTLRALLAAGRIASTSDDPARALSPSIDDDGDIRIRLALRGDLNGDDALDGDDYFALDRAFLMEDDLTPQADLTLDNRVDAADYFLLDRAFLTLAPAAPAASPLSSTLFDADPSPLHDLLR